MRSDLVKRLVAVVLCAGLCLCFSACGAKDNNTVSSASVNDVSSNAGEEPQTQLERLVQEEDFQAQVKALSQTYESKGMRLEVVAENDSVVYRCIYTVAVDASKSKEELAEHLESKAFETSISSVLRSFKAQVPQTHSVIVRYIDMDGNIIASKEYK